MVGLGWLSDVTKDVYSYSCELISPGIHSLFLEPKTAPGPSVLSETSLVPTTHVCFIVGSQVPCSLFLSCFKHYFDVANPSVHL